MRSPTVKIARRTNPATTPTICRARVDEAADELDEKPNEGANRSDPRGLASWLPDLDDVDGFKVSVNSGLGEVLAGSFGGEDSVGKNPRFEDCRVVGVRFCKSKKQRHCGVALEAV